MVRVVVIALTLFVGFADGSRFWSDGTITAEDDCFTAIKKLSVYDEKFSKRLIAKLDFPRENLTDAQYETELTRRTLALNGTEARCDPTADWIIDVFRGTHENPIPRQVVTGDAVRALFQEYASGAKSKQHWLFHFYNAIPADLHVWLVEQVPPLQENQEPAYRVYQSYGGAFSLRAWLSGANEQTSVRYARIIENEITFCRRPENFAKCSRSEIEYSQVFFGKLENATKTEYPEYYSFIMGLRRESALKTFDPSWREFGQGLQGGITDRDSGSLVAKEYFLSNYVSKLVGLSNLMVDTTKGNMSENAYGYFKVMFGTQMLYFYPEVPLDTMVDGEKPNDLLVNVYSLIQDKKQQNEHCAKQASMMQPNLAASAVQTRLSLLVFIVGVVLMILKL